MPYLHSENGQRRNIAHHHRRDQHRSVVLRRPRSEAYEGPGSLPPGIRPGNPKQSPVHPTRTPTPRTSIKEKNAEPKQDVRPSAGPQAIASRGVVRRTGLAPRNTAPGRYPHGTLPGHFSP
mgnify:CR=1 FL=1